MLILTGLPMLPLKQVMIQAVFDAYAFNRRSGKVVVAICDGMLSISAEFEGRDRIAELARDLCQ
jgi:hypothetical protein